MLNQRISRIGPARTTDRRRSDRSDRAMDVLQYGTAFLAFAVAALLAALH